MAEATESNKASRWKIDARQRYPSGVVTCATRTRLGRLARPVMLKTLEDIVQVSNPGTGIFDNYLRVAQFGRVSGLGPEGWTFKSSHGDHFLGSSKGRRQRTLNPLMVVRAHLREPKIKEG